MNGSTGPRALNMPAITLLDVVELGTMVKNLVHAAAYLGHDNPTMSVVYHRRPDSLVQEFLHDLLVERLSTTEMADKWWSTSDRPDGLDVAKRYAAARIHVPYVAPQQPTLDDQEGTDR